jgi:hypothetical protein
MDAMDRASAIIALAAAASLVACGQTTTSKDTDASASGGSPGSGGASASGGSGTGGAAGASQGGRGGGGTTGSGGKSAAGGKSASGGGPSSGGATQSAGGRASAGGKTSSGSSSGASGAPTDAGPAIDAGCDDAVVSSVSWGSNGGLVRYQDTSKLDPPRAYTHERDNQGNALPITCHTELAGCPSAKIAEINGALQDLTVTAALAAHTVFGVDSRPVDGAVFRIQVGGGYVDVGSACPPQSSSCRPIPPIVERLRLLLTSIDTAELAKADCAGKFP